MNKELVSKEIQYSVLIPVFNEEDSIEMLYRSLKVVMGKLGKEYEIIFVNDGSVDQTRSRISDLINKDISVRKIDFQENRGQGAAIECGFLAARGKIIITLDGDLQNDPRDIPKLLSEIDRGFDLVCGWRFKRNSSLIKVLKSKMANTFQRIVTRVDLHDMSCTLRAYRREIISDIRFSGKFEFSFLPYIISRRRNIKIKEVKINDSHRKYGKTKYKTLPTTLGTIQDYFCLLFKSRLRNNKFN